MSSRLATFFLGIYLKQLPTGQLFRVSDVSASCHLFRSEDPLLLDNVGVEVFQVYLAFPNGHHRSRDAEPERPFDELFSQFPFPGASIGMPTGNRETPAGSSCFYWKVEFPGSGKEPLYLVNTCHQVVSGMSQAHRLHRVQGTQLTDRPSARGQ